MQKSSNRQKGKTIPSKDTHQEVAALNFPVVGIGASAGGYEACSLLLSNLPSDTGMAYIIVQHLHPSYVSSLTELLSKSTMMPVKEIKDEMLVEPNHIYVIPPNYDLEIFHGKLQLSLRDTKSPHLPIDRFLRSMADELGSKAIGVILSGTASDGVMGLRAIKAEGGITFSQDEKSAKFNGMPHSAIASGCVDFVLPPDKIAQELKNIAHHPYVQLLPSKKPDNGKESETTDKKSLNKIFLLLRKKTGIDFTYYKMTTIQRRIVRRMLLHKIQDLKQYISYLQTHTEEIDALYQDMLINVTEFFRDQEAFDTLKDAIFPRIFGQETRYEPVRVWIPGCSTGEEVYSIVISLLEYIDDFTPIPIQVFATDIDDNAIEKARQGIYQESINTIIDKQRLQRFFNKMNDGSYQIKKDVRDLCIFAKQNVFKDPPFSKIDLISCRNLLIYLSPVLQKRILSIFHYALNNNGFLFLGSAETVGEHTDLYKTVDQKHKFYAKKSISYPLHLEFSVPILSADFNEKINTQVKQIEAWNGINLQQMTDRMIMQKYAPAAVVINEEMQILQFRGHTGRFLEPAPGEASFHILNMARDGLQQTLRSLLAKSMAEHITMSNEKTHYKYDNTIEYVDIEITPIQHPTQREYCYLVVFSESTPLPSNIEDKKNTKQTEGEKTGAEDSNHLALSQELAATKEYLQSVIEQQEISNEELRSANEEIQSSNEELQSINEELETAKEELQSTNEELATVNEELETRNIQLARLNDDHTNFINSLNIAFLTLDNNLKIRNFTPKTKDLLNIINSDIGRPISDIKLKFKFPNLEQLILDSIEQVSNKTLEFLDDNNHWYSIRIRPYRTLDNRIDGVVVAFLDVNELKADLTHSKFSLDYAESILAAIHHPLLVLDKNLRVLTASKSYYETFKVAAQETIGNLLYRLGNGEWAIPQLREKLMKVIEEEEPLDNFTVEHKFENIGLQRINVTGRKIKQKSGEESLVLMQLDLDRNNNE